MLSRVFSVTTIGTTLAWSMLGAASGQVASPTAQLTRLTVAQRPLPHQRTIHRAPAGHHARPAGGGAHSAHPEARPEVSRMPATALVAPASPTFTARPVVAAPNGGGHPLPPDPQQSDSPAPTPPPPPPTPGCTGAPLTAQAQVQPNTSYCGGRVTSAIYLAVGDTWTGGEVTGASTGVQHGAVNCPSNCHLVDMNVHDNPNAFAGISMENSGSNGVTIRGGRVTGSGSLGIGGGGTDGLVIDGVEIDHNGAAANCNFEGGGFKAGAAHHLHLLDNYVHDNGCSGVWLDINSANVEIDHNRIDGNADGGVFYEISQDGSIHDNSLSGNGFRANGNGCGWLWGAAIGVASSFNVQVFGNTLAGNCNGIAGTQQNRPDSAPPAHLLANLNVHGNTVTNSGRSGAVEDNGADLSSRNILFAGNAFGGAANFCGLAC